MALYDELKRLAQTLNLDVLSLYILDAEKKELFLVESYGLYEAAVGSRIPIEKGLVGRCARTGLPVARKNPQEDPDFYYLPGSGEERLHSFLALPIKDTRGELKAIVVAQTINPKVFRISEIEQILRLVTPEVTRFIEKSWSSIGKPEI